MASDTIADNFNAATDAWLEAIAMFGREDKRTIPAVIEMFRCERILLLDCAAQATTDKSRATYEREAGELEFVIDAYITGTETRPW